MVSFKPSIYNPECTRHIICVLKLGDKEVNYESEITDYEKDSWKNKKSFPDSVNMLNKLNIKKAV